MMNKFDICPECGKALSLKSKTCSCGWKKSEKHLPAAQADHRCEYQVSGRRCPLPGTMCPYPYGKGPWYCSGHWRTLSDPRLGEAVLRDAEENYQKIMDDRRDWRRKLFETPSQKNYGEL